MKSAPPEGGGHQGHPPQAVSVPFTLRDSTGMDLAPGLDATSLWWRWDYGLACWVRDLEPAVNLLQIHAILQLATVAASAATFLLSLQPAPSLEKKMLNELQTKQGLQSQRTCNGPSTHLMYTQ